MSDNSDFLDAALSVIPSSENAPANPNKAFLDAAISSLPEPEVDPNAPGMAETAGRTVLNEVGPSTAALAAATATAPLGAVSFGVIPALAAVAAYGVSKYSIRKGREFLIDKGPADEIAARELAGQQANPGTAQIAGMVGQVPLMLTGPAALAGKAP